MPDDFDELDFDPADWNSVDAMLDFLRSKVPMPAEEFYALEEDARQRAFTVSGVADLDIVVDVWEAIDSAVANGETLEDFRKRVGEKLAGAWGEDSPSRLEAIFRTNAQAAYSAGREAMRRSPAVMQSHPYTAFSVVDDDRTSDICEELVGVVLPADHPFVLSHVPPLHVNCRTDATPITEAEAKELGIDEDVPDVEADEGFGGDPLAEWAPDVSSRPAELASMYELKLRQ